MIPATPILIIEDSVVTSVAVGRILEQAVPECHIVRAQSCFEAQLLLRIYDFRLAVVDINLPDGCGLDLVPTILSRRPSAGIIVMTADALPDHRQRSTHLGIHHFIPKPVDAEALRAAARNSIGRRAATARAFQFTASLTGVSLFDIVQLKCLNRASCRLEVSSADSGLLVATIDFERGEIVHAEVCDSSLKKLAEGEEALTHIFSWDHGHIEECASTGAPPDRTIRVPWQALLLSAAQRSDEHTATDASVSSPRPGSPCRPNPLRAGHTSFIPNASTDRRCPA